MQGRERHYLFSGFGSGASFFAAALSSLFYPRPALDMSAALWSTNLTNATFRSARMTDAKLMFAELRGADLTDADLRGAILTDAQLQKQYCATRTSRTRCSSADLSGAKLEKVKLKGAIFDAATVWPAKFDPRAAGAKMDGEPLGK